MVELGKTKVFGQIVPGDKGGYVVRRWDAPCANTRSWREIRKIILLDRQVKPAGNYGLFVLQKDTNPSENNRGAFIAAPVRWYKYAELRYKIRVENNNPIVDIEGLALDKNEWVKVSPEEESAAAFVPYPDLAEKIQEVLNRPFQHSCPVRTIIGNLWDSMEKGYRCIELEPCFGGEKIYIHRQWCIDDLQLSDLEIARKLVSGNKKQIPGFIRFELCDDKGFAIFADGRRICIDEAIGVEGCYVTRDVPISRSAAIAALNRQDLLDKLQKLHEKQRKLEGLTEIRVYKKEVSRFSSCYDDDFLKGMSYDEDCHPALLRRGSRSTLETYTLCRDEQGNEVEIRGDLQDNRRCVAYDYANTEALLLRRWERFSAYLQADTSGVDARYFALLKVHEQ